MITFSLRAVHAQLKRPFESARGSISDRSALIVVAENSSGCIGFGEAAPLPGWSHETLDQAQDQIQRILERNLAIEAPRTLADWADCILRLGSIEALLPSVKFALETALADVASQKAGLSLCNWLNPNASGSIPVNAVVAATRSGLPKLSPDQLRSQIIKVKVAPENVDRIPDFLRETLPLLRPKAQFRLDANGSLDLRTAINLLTKIEDLPIEYFEEPIADLAAWSELRKKSKIPLAFDESLWAGEDPIVLLSKPHCDGIVIKPTLAGGILETLRLAQIARANGLFVSIGSTLEIGPGLLAAMHSAAAVFEPRACGFDTANLFPNSITEDLPQPIDGVLSLGAGLGLGRSFLKLYTLPQMEN